MENKEILELEKEIEDSIFNEEIPQEISQKSLTEHSNVYNDLTQLNYNELIDNILLLDDDLTLFYLLELQSIQCNIFKSDKDMYLLIDKIITDNKIQLKLQDMQNR